YIRRRMFVTFEGVDWSGKSTQAELLATWLRGHGRTVTMSREPGGTELAESVRELVLHRGDMSPWAEAALYAAARADNAALVIRPALERGEDVVCDRYLDSSVAYQGGARPQPARHRWAAARPYVRGGHRPRRGSAPRRRRSRPDRARGRRVHATGRRRVSRARDGRAGENRAE